ncbi:hypothetical protein B0H17DRAFT_1144802 [Mycena rosella]|uniref:Uncharacterized protein n=1 Tax=Mycena rosella TaxID=1033263 RepID=A0AAD7G2J6_MYCRO|nr:hypothetical protein B0H17DRAFT_1144802 [Mycena rosella]
MPLLIEEDTLLEELLSAIPALLQGSGNGNGNGMASDNPQPQALARLYALMEQQRAPLNAGAGAPTLPTSSQQGAPVQRVARLQGTVAAAAPASGPSQSYSHAASPSRSYDHPPSHFQVPPMSLSAQQHFIASPHHFTASPNSTSPNVNISFPGGTALFPAFLLSRPTSPPVPYASDALSFNVPRRLNFYEAQDSLSEQVSLEDSPMTLLPGFSLESRRSSGPSFPLLSPLRTSVSLPPSPMTFTSTPSRTPPSPPSPLQGPTSPTSPSPNTAAIATAPSSSRKRKAAQAGLKQPSPRRSQSGAQRSALAGAGRDDQADDADYADASLRRRRRRPPRAPRSPCPRGGNAARVTRPAARNPIAASVHEMQRQLLEGAPENGATTKTKGRGGKMSKRDKETVWLTDGEPPVATREPALRIVELSLLAISADLQHELADLIFAFQDQANTFAALSASGALTSTSNRSESLISGFARVMTRCGLLEAQQVKLDFQLMMSYIQASFYIQARLNVPKGEHPPSYYALAQEVSHSSVTASSIQNWYKAGSRLIYLAAASSMYLIPMIAIAGNKRQLSKEDNLDVIQRMAYLLCVPHVIPQMLLIEQVTTQLEDAFSLGFPPDSSGISEVIPFKDVDRMAARLRLFDFNYFKLPPFSPCWNALKDPLLAPALPLTLENMNITPACVAEEITIRTTLDLKATPCPVNPANSKAWTEAERVKAAAAPVATSIDDLRRKAGGKRKTDGYVCIPSDICEGVNMMYRKVLTLRDCQDKLIAMLITNLSKTLPHLNTTALPFFSAVMTGEVYPIDSSEVDSYCATHKVFWARYGEQGHTAPKNVHPYNVRKEGATRVNFTQRAPHTSEEMKEDPMETELIAEFIKLVTIVIEFHLKTLLPNEYYSISVFASKLPLNERSLAHLFGGYVINIRVSTRGHRDTGDKLFCVVIPFGEWTGGELVTFEPGCVFRPKAWDAIIFPSCDITHFNLEHQGSRLSLVLHSDKYGDGWVQDLNGWEARNV